MQPTSKPVSKLKVVLLWFILVANIIFWAGFWLMRNRGNGHDTVPAVSEEGAPDVVRMIIMLVFGGIFLLGGILSYIIVLSSDCFTFNFQRPVWKVLKGKMYLANIIVPVASALGLGFALSAFVSPVLAAAGLTPPVANLLPVMAMVVVLQVVQIWVLVWAPLEKRVITKRLLAQGITPAQLQTATLLGISNPARSSFKKFAQVEEDIGAFWVGQDQLVYWGDAERFSILREQLAELERKADAGSMTFLSGMTHVILHVRLPDGSERQIRLHPEGVWTQGKKRQAMDNLAQAITQWHARGATAPAAMA